MSLLADMASSSQHHDNVDQSHALQHASPVTQVQPELLMNRRDVFDGTSGSSTSSTASTCGPKDTTGACQRSTGGASNTTIAIVLGVVIPLSVAFIVLVYLHRRHVQKLRKEDAEDKHGSLDFGWESKQAWAHKKKKGGDAAALDIPEMALRDAKGGARRGRGISMDYGMSDPYLLPLELHESRESLHSLSRTMTSAKDDKYRATTFIPDDGSLRSPSSLKGGWDDTSSYSGSLRRKMDGESTKGLITNGAPVGQGTDPSSNSIARRPVPDSTGATKDLLAPVPAHTEHDSRFSTTSSVGMGSAIRASNNYLGHFINSGHPGPSGDVNTASSPVEARAGSGALRHDPATEPNALAASTSNFDFELPNESMHPVPILPQVQITPTEDSRSEPVIHQQERDVKAGPPGVGEALQEHEQQRQPQHDRGSESFTQQYSSSGHTASDLVQHQLHAGGEGVPVVRVDDSSYDDYYEEDEGHYDIEEYTDVLGYDPRLLHLGMRPLPPDDPSENAEQRANRIRSFYKEYFDESAKPGRRTSYMDGSENYIDDYYGTAQSSPYGSRGPSMAGPRGPRQRRAMSNNSYTYNGPRAFSSASGPFGHGPGPGPRRPPVKRRMPPPQPLNLLPTPHKLQDDSMLPNPMDYAPPQVFKNQRAGTPDSMKGGTRAFSPSTRAFNPLVSSFDDLAVLPSPHALRKSGIFTSLDFAPPRFAGPESGGSDSGSIRSHHSGVSRIGQHNIRAGAYRISRIPREVAGTRDELSAALRPQMNMTR